MLISDMVGHNQTITINLGGKFGTTIELRMLSRILCEIVVQMGGRSAIQYAFSDAEYGERVGQLFGKLVDEFIEATDEALKWEQKARRL